MGVVVQKYGGTSVADADRIRAVADRIVSARKAGNDVCVVVSAMGRTTDGLVTLAHEVSSMPAARELDMLLTAGERVSIALLCMALIDRGFEAASFTGSQAGILTDTDHGRARILDVKAERLRDAIAAGRIAVVAGFQGVSTERDVTTLGRGGSDTSAVALAAALDATECEIFTDVDGVFTADPRRVPTARKLDHISYDEMLELAACGAKVLHSRSVEFARNFGVRVHVRSSFHERPGTLVVEANTMEEPIISGVAHDTTEVKVTLAGVPDKPGIASHVFAELAKQSVRIDMIVQNVSHDGKTDVSFTVPTADLATARPAVEAICGDVAAGGYDIDEEIAKISLVGAGMKTHPGVAAKMFGALADVDVNIEMISTSPIRIACVVRSADLDAALRSVHDRFALGSADSEVQDV